MAFTPQEKRTICKILEINIIQLDLQLATYVDHIDTESETAVTDEIERWTNGAGTKFVRVKPFGQNEGTDFDPEAEKADIRKNIGLMLLFPESVYGGSSDSFEIQKG